MPDSAHAAPAPHHTPTRPGSDPAPEPPGPPPGTERYVAGRRDRPRRDGRRLPGHRRGARPRGGGQGAPATSTRPAPAAARRFVDEARITGQLQHPGIPPVHDLGTLPDGRPFLAMKLIKGEHPRRPARGPARPGRRPRPVRGRVRAGVPGGRLRPRPRRHPPRPEAGERHGRGVRRGPGHGLGARQGARAEPRRPGRTTRTRTAGGRRSAPARHRRARSTAGRAASSGTPAYMPPGAGRRGGRPGRRAARRVRPRRRSWRSILTGQPPFAGRDGRGDPADGRRGGSWPTASPGSTRAGRTRNWSRCASGASTREKDGPAGRRRGGGAGGGGAAGGGRGAGPAGGTGPGAGRGRAARRS